MCIVSIFGYSVYFTCKKMMGTGLKEVDIEFFKIVSTNIVIILCFYYGGNSARDIIQSLFNDSKLFNKNNRINNNIIYGESNSTDSEINSGENNEYKNF